MIDAHTPEQARARIDTAAKLTLTRKNVHDAYAV